LHWLLEDLDAELAGAAEGVDVLGRVWRHDGCPQDPGRSGPYRGIHNGPRVWSHRRDGGAPLRSPNTAVERLCGKQPEWLQPAAGDWRIQGRALRGVFARTLGGPVHFLSRALVGDHRYLVPLGASVFRRWWQNVGNQLDFGLCAQRLDR